VPPAAFKYSQKFLKNSWGLESDNSFTGLPSRFTQVTQRLDKTFKTSGLVDSYHHFVIKVLEICSEEL